ncbi:MAG TPA: hypothetical protein VFV42_09325 [Acidimicrobiales bacterium]|nr:hypothetical protein [Acidimicrobiales bacterium]
MELRAFQRTLAAGAVWTAAMAGLLVASPSASGQESVEPGRGNAYAQGVKVDPRSGRLSFGITYGMALAGHQNAIAIAEARSADLGTIGTTLAGEGCSGGDPTLPAEDQPQPLEARSNEEGADQEKVGSENGVERRVVASAEPYARAIAAAAGAGDPAVFRVGGTTSTTESGLVDGARLARARTEIEELTFAGGQVVLRGLRWEAVYQTAPTEETAGSFTIDGLEVAGQRIPLPEDNPAAALEEANAALEPLGFRLRIPTPEKKAGIQFVDPLRISIIPSTARETVLGPAFSAVSPVRESVFDAIIEAECSSASVISILDIVLNSITGAGSLNIEVGGVTATSDDIELTSFLGGLGGAPSLPPLRPGTTGGSSGSLGTPTRSGGTLGTGNGSGTGTGATAVTGDDAGDTEGGGQELAGAEPISSEGARGGALAGVGLGGLALLAALAAGDRHKMRKAQRSVLMETF